MKQSQLYILISNLYLVGSFLIDSILGGFLMILLGMLWLIGAIMCMKNENALRKVENTLEQARFEILIHVLNKKRKKK